MNAACKVGEGPSVKRLRTRSETEQGQLNWIANFIWGIADDVLRDLYVRDGEVQWVQRKTLHL